MFIKKSFKVRHQILKVLFYHNLKFKPSETRDSKCLHFDKICEELPQYDRPFLLDNLDYLRSTNEIYCSQQFDNSVFDINSSGSHSFRNKKYIRDGVKDLTNYIYDIAKTVSVIVLLAIAIWTFAQNTLQTKQNKTDIEQLRKELQDIKSKPKELTL